MADTAGELDRPQLQPVTQGWIDQRVFDLYDEYCHGRIDRRAFLSRAAAVTVARGGSRCPASATR